MAVCFRLNEGRVLRLESAITDYDSRRTWDSGLDAGSTPARSIKKGLCESMVPFYEPECIRGENALRFARHFRPLINDLPIKSDSARLLYALHAFAPVYAES